MTAHRTNSNNGDGRLENKKGDRDREGMYRSLEKWMVDWRNGGDDEKDERVIRNKDKEL